MAKYQKYVEYKDSGIEWLGEIPSHWEMWKLSHAYNEIGSGTTPPTSNEENFEGDIPWITTGELRENVILDTKKKVSQRTIELFPTLRKYPRGSVAIAMYGATIGRLGIFGVEATTNQACCVMTISKMLNNKYIFYWLQAFKSEIIQLSSGGGQPNINQEKVASLKISAPVIKDQITVVDFLDHETAKIDTLIAKQEKLIELLKEKRQAVISHAVTKGLNTNVAMKDSGVEWLGEVPEHWEIGRVKDLALVISKGTTPSTMGGDFVDDGIRFLKAENIGKRFDVNPTPEFFITEQVDEQLSRSRLQENDVLVIIAGATTGLASVLQKDLLPANTNQAVSFVRLKNVKYSQWLAFWLTTKFAQSTIWMGAVQSAQPNLSMESLGNITLPIPYPEEVEIILEKIQLELQTFDLLIEKAKSAIQLMQERRTALISAAVTGKIDVRDWENPNKNKEADMELSA